MIATPLPIRKLLMLSCLPLLLMSCAAPPEPKALETLPDTTDAAVSDTEQAVLDTAVVQVSKPYQPTFPYQPIEGLEYIDLIWNTQKTTRATTLIYDSEKPKTRVVDTLPPGTEVATLGYFNVYDTLLSEVQYGEKRGFLSNGELYLYHWDAPAIVTDFKAFLAYKEGKPGDHAIPEIQVRAFEKGSTNQISSITLPMYSHGFHVKKTINCALENIDALINVSRYRESCPGGERSTFVAYQDGSFQELLTVGTSGEMGMYSNQFLYFPMWMEDGSIQLVRDCVPLTYPTEDGRRLDVFEKPDSVNVPIHQLVVLEEETADAVMNEAGTGYVENEDGSYQIEVTYYKVQYYRWDGTKLKPLL